MRTKNGNIWLYGGYKSYQQNTATVENSKTIPIYSNGSNLTDYSFEGQCSQASTPTPSSPVEVEEFGDLIPNLCTSTNIVGSNYAMYTPNISNYINDNDKFSVYIETDINFVNSSIYLVTSSQQFVLATINTQNGKIEVTVDFTSEIKSAIASSTTTVYFKLYKSGADFTNTTNVMIVTGSQVIPYGTGTNYKIPVTSAGQTQNIILSEPLCKIDNHADNLESEGVVTRRIKKLVLDGTEDWQKWGDSYIVNISSGYQFGSTALSTHYAWNATMPRVNEQFSIVNYKVWIRDDSQSTLADFTTFLAQQYTNGTPVTVYYVLRTPTTESVTAPTIPTSSGFSNIEIGTNLAPSKFEYDLGKMFMPQVEKVRQNGEWV
jgi:hypothetical protein